MAMAGRVSPRGRARRIETPRARCLHGADRLRRRRAGAWVQRRARAAWRQWRRQCRSPPASLHLRRRGRGLSICRWVAEQPPRPVPADRAGGLRAAKVGHDGLQMPAQCARFGWCASSSTMAPGSPHHRRRRSPSTPSPRRQSRASSRWDSVISWVATACAFAAGVWSVPAARCNAGAMDLGNPAKRSDERCDTRSYVESTARRNPALRRTSPVRTRRPAGCAQGQGCTSPRRMA